MNRWTYVWLVIQLNAAMIYGCSCPPNSYNQPACEDYKIATDVYTARVINATCSCIPGVNYHDVNSLYNTTNVTCVSAGINSGQLLSETVNRTTCDAYDIFYGILPCINVMTNFAGCPYEGQMFMDCVSSCPTTCSNMGVASPCPSVCIRGCGCPDGMVINEEQRRCVMPSQCPNHTACPLDGQVTTLCTSLCPRDCFRTGNESCVQVCNECTCAPPMIADYITGKCVQPEQCTACPINGQVYTECGSSCPQTCDNVNESIICNTGCWQGCECPSGMVIDVENRRCVDPSQCTNNRSEPPVVQRISENGRCEPRFVCPFNEDESTNYLPCQYTVEVTRVYKGTLKAGQVIIHDGPDLLTTCGSPNNILSVGTSYIVGIGGPCSAYSEWTPYSQYPMEDLQALSNGCSNFTFSSVTVTPSSSVTTGSSVRPTSTSRVDDDGSSGNSITSNLMVLVGAMVLMLYF